MRSIFGDYTLDPQRRERRGGGVQHKQRRHDEVTMPPGSLLYSPPLRRDPLPVIKHAIHKSQLHGPRLPRRGIIPEDDLRLDGDRSSLGPYRIEHACGTADRGGRANDFLHLRF